MKNKLFIYIIVIIGAILAVAALYYQRSSSLGECGNRGLTEVCIKK